MLALFRIFRVILYPVLRYIMPLLNKNAAKRVEFELRNYTEVPSLACADYGFEVSSEGEFEQIKVVLLDVLEKGKSVELIYCSPSVETQCQNILKLYPNTVRLYRYPLFTYSPFSKRSNPYRWLTCQTLVLCRYDFFPELINYGKTKAQNFILLSGSLKNFKKKNYFSKKYLEYCYKCFDKIISSSVEDKKQFEALFEIQAQHVAVFDFRVLQILNRLEHKEMSIKNKVPHAQMLIDFVRTIPETKKILFGSYWDSEFGILKKELPRIVEEKVNIFLAPHKLDEQSILKIKQGFEQSGLEVFELNKNTTEQELSVMITKSQNNHGIWILNLKGVLCELYTFFKLVYVGGGFGVSIHSVLEPFLAKAVVFCGPKTFRSSEFSLINESNPDRLHRVEKQREVLKKMEDVDLNNLSQVDTFIDHYKGNNDQMIKWLGL